MPHVPAGAPGRIPQPSRDIGVLMALIPLACSCRGLQGYRALPAAGFPEFLQRFFREKRLAPGFILAREQRLPLRINKAHEKQIIVILEFLKKFPGIRREMPLSHAPPAQRTFHRLEHSPGREA